MVRQIGDVTEVIARDGAAEAAALEQLSELGFRKPQTPPLNGLAGALQLESQAHWLRFAEGELDGLSDRGWHVHKSAKYRYDVVAVEDWYAEIDEPAEAERVFLALSDGGQVRMPLQETFWARRFGMLADRFGTPWMINCEKPQA